MSRIAWGPVREHAAAIVRASDTAHGEWKEPPMKEVAEARDAAAFFEVDDE